MQYKVGTARIVPDSTTPSAPSRAQGSAGNVNAGTHSWKVTFVHTNGGESLPSAASSQLNVSPASQVNLSSISLGPSGTSARRIYRTVTGDTGNYKLVGTIADNTTTIFTDNIADAGLGVDAPSASTFPTDTVELTGGAQTTGNFAAGNLFKFRGEQDAWFVVSNLASLTTFTLTTKYNGTKVAGTYYPYEVNKGYTTNLSLVEIQGGDVDSADAYTRSMRLIDAILAGHTTAMAGYTEFLRSKAGSESNITLGVRAVASQTGDLIRLENSAGTSLLNVTKDGFVGVNTVATSGGNTLMKFGGPFTGSTQTELLRMNPSLTGTVGNSVFGAVIEPTFIEAGSGTHPQLTSLYIASAVTNGGATTTSVFGVNIDTIATSAIAPTNAAALRIAVPTGATNNYSIWVVSGESKFDGIVSFNSSLTVKVSGTNALSFAPDSSTTTFTLSSRDLGNGLVGPGIIIGRNSNGTNTGAGYLALTSKANTQFNFWVDTNGVPRYSNVFGPSNANDLLGTPFNPMRGYLFGCILSNAGGDPTNDITVSAGMAATDESSFNAVDYMLLASALTKQLDATWAVGNNAGGRDTGSIANGTWHVFVIMRPDTRNVDVLFSLSPTAPTLPTNYTKFRRIGSILRESGAIVLFIQDGDFFQRLASILDVNVTNPGASAVTRTLSVPNGIRVRARMNVSVRIVGTASVCQITDLSVNNEAPDFTTAPLGQLDCSLSNETSQAQVEVMTNTSNQVRSRLSASDANTELRIATLGWTDTRNRLA